MEIKLEFIITVLSIVVKTVNSNSDHNFENYEIDKLLSLFKKESTAETTKLCLDDEGDTHADGELFLQDAGCTSCQFDSECSLSCVPSERPHCKPTPPEEIPSFACRAGEKDWYKPGETFWVLDGCYSCVFSETCRMTCEPSGECGKSVKGCEEEGRYHAVGEEFEGTCKPGSCEFNQFCQKMCVCARNILDLLRK